MLAGVGDAIGVVAALFSGLPFAGVIYALVMQRPEFGLQRRELELHRCELSLGREGIAGQRGEMELQNLTLQKLMRRPSTSYCAFSETQCNGHVKAEHITQASEVWA